MGWIHLPICNLRRIVKRVITKKVITLVTMFTMAMPLFAAADGAAIYKARCVACHGVDGARTMPALGVKQLNTPAVKKLGAVGVTNVVTKGQGKMPSFNGKLTAEEISATATHVLSLK